MNHPKNRAIQACIWLKDNIQNCAISYAYGKPISSMKPNFVNV